jgi:hypothetical protein
MRNNNGPGSKVVLGGATISPKMLICLADDNPLYASLPFPLLFLYSTLRDLLAFI